MADLNFEILQHVCILSERSSGWKREVNIVSWNGASPKFDIRDWGPGRKSLSRGITLNQNEFNSLVKHIKYVRSGIWEEYKVRKSEEQKAAAGALPGQTINLDGREYALVAISGNTQPVQPVQSAQPVQGIQPVQPVQAVQFAPAPEIVPDSPQVQTAPTLQADATEPIAFTAPCTEPEGIDAPEFNNEIDLFPEKQLASGE